MSMGPFWRQKKKPWNIESNEKCFFKQIHLSCFNSMSGILPLWDTRANLQVVQIFALHALSTEVNGLLPLISIENEEEEDEDVKAQQYEHFRKSHTEVVSCTESWRCAQED